ncbi:MAG: glycosyltransferase 61 family protein, partial [Pseudomonas alloputida]
ISPGSNSLMRSIGFSLRKNGESNKADYKFNYLDRDDERRSFRALTNEQELKGEFVRRSFELKTPGAMSFSEKYSMFSACKGLAGQYGGGLQLCFLAPFGTKIIVIQSELFTRPHIDFMAGILGFEVLNVQADQDDEEAHANASVKVDFESVVSALDKLGIF